MNPFIIGFLFALACGLPFAAVAQTAEVPAIDVSTPNRVIPIKANKACGIDFKNIRVSGADRRQTVRLKSGEYKRKYDSGYEAVGLENVFCLEPGKGKAQRAIIVLSWLDCGGSCSSTGVVQLVSIHSQHPVVIQQFVFDSHADGTGATFNEKSQTLTVTGRSDDGSPHCCARNLDVVTYRWQGSKFVQGQYKRVPAPI
jgi:hypothetical protein